MHPFLLKEILNLVTECHGPSAPLWPRSVRKRICSDRMNYCYCVMHQYFVYNCQDEFLLDTEADVLVKLCSSTEAWVFHHFSIGKSVIHMKLLY